MRAEPLLMQALVAGEDPRAVPLDEAVAGPGAGPPALFLRPGRYLLRVVDRSGTVLSEEEHVVSRS